MFEHFTQEGSDQHAKKSKIREVGAKLTDLMIKPYTRLALQPVLIKGCGEPIVTIN